MASSLRSKVARLVAGTCLALAGGCAPPPVHVQPKLEMSDVHFQMNDLRFPSGLRVLLEEDHRSPSVSIVTLVGTGAADDPPGKAGLAHFVEHLAFRTKPDGTTTSRAALARAGAGALNAMTQHDSTIY